MGKFGKSISLAKLLYFVVINRMIEWCSGDNSKFSKITITSDDIGHQGVLLVSHLYQRIKKVFKYTLMYCLIPLEKTVWNKCADPKHSCQGYFMLGHHFLSFTLDYDA